MAAKYTNNASTTLASSISASATAFSVPSGKGDLFPILGAGDYCYLTLVKLVGGLEVLEIVKATARAGDNFTVVRGQDGTAATTFTGGDKVDCRVVAAGLNEKAALDSPALLNNPTAPTQLATDDTTKLSTTAFANRAAANAIAQVAGGTTTLASAATVNIGAAGTGNISITGTASILAFDTVAEGTLRWIVFAGALVLTHNVTSLQLPTAANITTATGDAALMKSLGGGNWKCLAFERASGLSLTQASASASGYLYSVDWNTFNGKQAALGYTPVQQGTGVGQGANVVKFGWGSSGGGLKCTIDVGDLGYVPFSSTNPFGGGAINFANPVTVQALTVGGAATINGAAAVNANGAPTTTGVAAMTVNGSFGGGYKMIDGANQTMQWMQSGVWNWGFGTGGAFASVMNLTNAGTLSAVTITQTSDERKKKKWQRLPSDFIAQLAGIKRSGLFTWKKGGAVSVGVGAQSLEAFLPQAVHTDAKGQKTVNYGGAALAASVELARKVVELEARLARLEKA